jgi:hypothetical protein
MSARIEARYWIETAYPLDQPSLPGSGISRTGFTTRRTAEVDGESQLGAFGVSSLRAVS